MFFWKPFALKKTVPYKLIAVTVLLLAASLLYGRARLERYDRQEGEKLTVALVQGNIAQDVKWNPAFLDETMTIYSRLTLAAAPEKPALVIWPEAATPFFFQSEQAVPGNGGCGHAQGRVISAAGKPGVGAMTGEGRNYFNSAFLVSPDGTISGRYDKIHLVPYGEYVPLKPLFPFIEKMVVGIGDFTSGREVKNLRFPGGSLRHTYLL